MKRLKARVRLEMAVALAAGILGLVTIFWHDWIEMLTGLDPDQHNGSVEWLLVAGLLAVAILATSRPDLRTKLLAYREELAAEVKKQVL